MSFPTESRIRSRPVAAPAWFTARLPKRPLDGELWLGRREFDALSAAVRRQAPRDDEWRQMRYMVFDLPHAPGPFAARAVAIESLAHDLDWPSLQAAPQATLADRAELQRRLEAGRMGALRLRTDEGADFLVGTGFSDAEREDPPPLGSVVTFSHRGSTAAGVPRFASYLRVREI